MENVFQNLLKSNNSLLSRSGEDINILAEGGDNSLGIYGLYTYPVNFFIFDTSSSAYQEGYEIVRNKANFILLLKNINDDPNTILSISNTGEEGTWEQITGFKKLEEECPEYFLLIPDLESIKDYLYSAPIDFQDWEKGYFKISYFSDHISQQFNIISEDDTSIASILFNLEIYDIEGTSITAGYSRKFLYKKENLSSFSSIKIQGVSEKDINNIIKISKDKVDWEIIEGFGRTDTSLIPPEAKNPYEFIGYFPKNLELFEYISNINFHDWDKAYIQCDCAKTEDNPEGITKELTIIHATEIQWESCELLSTDKLNFIENKLQEVSNSNYVAKTWQDNEIIDLTTVNNWENITEQYGFNYIKHSWVEGEEITAEKLNNINTSIITIGTVRIKDNIASICVYDAGSQQDWGRYIFVDRDHDLCYYFKGNDFLNIDKNTLYESGAIYRWNYSKTGGASPTGIIDIEIGKGLSNTNSLIALNIDDPDPDRLLWNKVNQFRSSHSNNWFIPSLNELLEIYNRKTYLNNISTEAWPKGWPNYWSSSEYNKEVIGAYYINFNDNQTPELINEVDALRSRLCWYL